jgi:hypothetical protein
MLEIPRLALRLPVCVRSEPRRLNGTTDGGHTAVKMSSKNQRACSPTTSASMRSLPMPVRGTHT